MKLKEIILNIQVRQSYDVISSKQYQQRSSEISYNFSYQEQLCQSHHGKRQSYNWLYAL